MSDACRSCDAPIVWAKTPAGKAMPLDAEPVPDGNINLTSWTSGLVATYLSGEDLNRARRDGERLHVSHFATCPDAEGWRKR